MAALRGGAVLLAGGPQPYRFSRVFGECSLPTGGAIFRRGLGAKAGALNDVWRSVDAGVSWEQLEDAPWAPRLDAGVVTLASGAVLVLGGQRKTSSSGGSYLADVWHWGGAVSGEAARGAVHADDEGMGAASARALWRQRDEATVHTLNSSLEEQLHAARGAAQLEEAALARRRAWVGECRAAAEALRRRLAELEASGGAVEDALGACRVAEAQRQEAEEQAAELRVELAAAREAAAALWTEAAQQSTLPPVPAMASAARLLRVAVIGAKGLAGSKGGALLYCVLEVVGKPESRFQTRAVENPHPFWDQEVQVEEYAAGDSLALTLMRQAEQGPAEDAVLGRAVLESHQLLPCGFEGDLVISAGGLDTGHLDTGRLAVKVSAPAFAGPEHWDLSGAAAETPWSAAASMACAAELLCGGDRQQAPPWLWELPRDAALGVLAVLAATSRGPAGAEHHAGGNWTEVLLALEDECEARARKVEDLRGQLSHLKRLQRLAATGADAQRLAELTELHAELVARRGELEWREPPMAWPEPEPASPRLVPGEAAALAREARHLRAELRREAACPAPLAAEAWRLRAALGAQRACREEADAELGGDQAAASHPCARTSSTSAPAGSPASSPVGKGASGPSPAWARMRCVYAQTRALRGERAGVRDLVPAFRVSRPAAGQCHI